MNDCYSPHTGEHIQTDSPAPWMGRAGVAAPVYDRSAAGCFWRGNHWEIIPAQPTDDTDRAISAKIDALWAAADRYTSGYISGVAIGILAIGVLQQKPKALAVAAWSSSIWSEYYARKALVTQHSVDNLDFSSFGPIPYSVPELQAEVGQ